MRSVAASKADGPANDQAAKHCQKRQTQCQSHATQKVLPAIENRRKIEIHWHSVRGPELAVLVCADRPRRSRIRNRPGRSTRLARAGCDRDRGQVNYFIVSITFCSAATSWAWIDFSTARNQARNSGCFLSIATPTASAFSMLPWQLFSAGSTASPFTLWLIGT